MAKTVDQPHSSEFDRFQDALRKVLSVPKEAVLREEARLKAERELHPRKAGRKKAKP